MPQVTSARKLNRLEQLVQDFLEYCEIERNKSQLTLRNYHHYLHRFLDFLNTKQISKPEQIDHETVRQFRLHLNRFISNGKPLKLITQQYHVIAVRAFLKYLAKRDINTLAPDKIELAKTPSREVTALRTDELKRLIEATHVTEDPLTRLRDQAILLTLFASGVRVSELTKLTRKQVNLDTGEFSVLGKGDKWRLTFLSPAAVDMIRNYLKARPDNHPALFIGHGTIGNSVTKQMAAIGGETGGLTPRTVQRLVKKYAMLAGITQKVSPHTLRHSFATDLLSNGADIRSVQTLLGHASITTTQIYTHVTNQGLREVHRKFHNKKTS